MEYYDPLKNNKVNMYEFGKISRKYCKGKKARCRTMYIVYYFLSITVLVNLFLIITPPRSLFKTFFS